MENICNIGGNSGQKQIGEFISGPRINIRHARAPTEPMHTAIYCIDFSTSKCQLLCFKMAAAAHFRCSYLALLPLA